MSRQQLEICDLESLPDMLAECRPTHVMSLLDRDDRLVVPLVEVVHLRLDMRDVDEPVPGAPTREQMAEAVAFVRALPVDARLLVHCHAGIGRSTAMLLVAHATLDGVGEAPLAQARAALLAQQPWAQPNRLMLRLADELLETGGALHRLGQAIRRAIDDTMLDRGAGPA